MKVLTTQKLEAATRVRLKYIFIRSQSEYINLIFTRTLEKARAEKISGSGWRLEGKREVGIEAAGERVVK